MKFGDVILCQKLYEGIIKHLMTPTAWSFHDAILYFMLRSGRKIRKSELLCFYLICLKFSIGGNFDMLITKRRRKLTLENDLSKKIL